MTFVILLDGKKIYILSAKQTTMRRLFILLIVADVVLTMIFLPWGMLINAAIMFLSLLVIIPVMYYRTFKTFGNKHS